MKAIITGATGATGKQLLEQLLADDSFTNITALVRKPVAIEHPKLQVAVVDFNNPEQWQHLVSGDTAFSCLGTTLKNAGSKEAQHKVDYGYQYAFAQAARNNAISTFILVSAGMANPKSLVFYSRMKGELENAVMALHFTSLVMFRPGLLSRPGTDRPGEKISESVLKLLNRIGLFKNAAPLKVHNLAKIMLRYAKLSPPGINIIESAQILKEITK